MTTSAEKTAAARARAANPTPEAVRFSQECRALRERLGLTQQGLADSLGLKEKHCVWRWENLKGSFPTKRTMKRFEELQHTTRLERGDANPKVIWFEG